MIVTQTSLTPWSRLRALMQEMIAAGDLPTYLSLDELGPGSSLRSLGLDSLTLMQLAASLSDSCQRNLTPAHLASLDNLNSVAMAAYGRKQSFEEQMKQRMQRVHEMRRQGHYFFGQALHFKQNGWAECDGRDCLLLGAYCYLDFAQDSLVQARARAYIERFGLGSPGARLLTGTNAAHLDLERRLALFLQSPAAMVVSTGFQTNSGVIPALVGADDCILADQYVHASLQDGIRLSGARVEYFRHNDLAHLEQLLQAHAASRILVVVDGVYSMEGDLAPLPQLIELRRQHSFWLMVDEAHSLGVVGARGGGVQDHFKLSPGDIDVKMGTLSKALGSVGGYIAGSEELIDYLRHHCRTYIFSGSPSGPQVAAAQAALEILEQDSSKVHQLQANADYLRQQLLSQGLRLSPSQSAILPVLFNQEDLVLRVVELCKQRGLIVVPVTYPAVPLDQPRIRLTVTSSHRPEDLSWAAQTLGDACRELGAVGLTDEG